MSTDGRYEIKFILDESNYTDVIRWINIDTTFRKTYPLRRVCSLYFDDTKFQSVNDNLAGVSDRKKTRLRWYQIGAQRDSISPPRLELKIRKGRLGYKRQFQMAPLLHKILNIQAGKVSTLISKQLISQHAPCNAFGPELNPLLLVNYSRDYYEDSNGIRLTIDTDIRFSQVIPSMSLLSLKAYLYRPKIMEIKFRPESKNHVVQLLKNLHLVPKRHSKYLVGLSLFGQVTYF